MSLLDIHSHILPQNPLAPYKKLYRLQMMDLNRVSYKELYVRFIKQLIFANEE